MLKKVTLAGLFIILGIYVYFAFIFDINNYKSELEDIRVLDKLVQASNARKKSAVGIFDIPKNKPNGRLSPLKTINLSEPRSQARVNMSGASME